MSSIWQIFKNDVIIPLDKKGYSYYQVECDKDQRKLNGIIRYLIPIKQIQPTSDDVGTALEALHKIIRKRTVPTIIYMEIGAVFTVLNKDPSKDLHEAICWSRIVNERHEFGVTGYNRNVMNWSERAGK